MRHLSRRARQVLKLAQEAAGEYEQGSVGTEHLLLGIVREGASLGARILLEQGATEYRVKSVVDELVEDRVLETWVTGRLPGSPHFIDVFARAGRIAQRLGQSQICTEHLLAALTTETGSVAYEALHALGLSREIIEEAFQAQAVQA